MSEALQASASNKKNLVMTDVDALVRNVPLIFSEGPVQEVVNKISDFEDGFVFVPVQKPRVEGDFYLAHKGYPEQSEKGEVILPEYSAVSAYYHLLRSSDTLRTLSEALTTGREADSFIAFSYIQRQISVSIYRKSAVEGRKTGPGVPDLFYLNSYDRSTREQIVLGHAFIGLKYMHRRSGQEKDSVKTIADLINDDEGYEAVLDRIRQYDMDLSLFRSFTTATKVPVRKVCTEFYGFTTEQYKEAEEDGKEIELFYNAVRNRHGTDGAMNLAQFVNFMHSLYRIQVGNEKFDNATRFVSAAANYMRKIVVPHFKLQNLI